MNETALLGAIGAACFGPAALGILVYTRVRCYRRAAAKLSAQGSPVTTEIEAGLGRYQPMFRLLSGEDAHFLEKHCRCPKLVQKWERSQRRVVRLYLAELTADVQSLHRQARALAAQSPEQYDYLIPLLFRQQLAFWRALIWVDISLTFGRRFSAINPARLAAAFDGLQREIARASVGQQSQPA